MSWITSYPDPYARHNALKEWDTNWPEIYDTAGNSTKQDVEVIIDEGKKEEQK